MAEFRRARGARTENCCCHARSLLPQAGMTPRAVVWVHLMALARRCVCACAHTVQMLAERVADGHMPAASIRGCKRKSTSRLHRAPQSAAHRLVLDTEPAVPSLKRNNPLAHCSSSSWAPRSFPNRAPPTSAADTCRAKRKHGERRKLRPPRAKEGVRRGCARAHRALTRSFEPADAGARGSERALVDSAPDRAPPHHRRQAERPTPWILDAARRERAPPRRGPRRVKRDPGPPTRSEAR